MLILFFSTSVCSKGLGFRNHPSKLQLRDCEELCENVLGASGWVYLEAVPGPTIFRGKGDTQGGECPASGRHSTQVAKQR